MKKINRRQALMTGVAVLGAARLAQAAKLPRPAPEFIISRTSGEQIRLSQFKGKVVILELLLTTCPHCQRSASAVQTIWSEYKAKGVEALGAAINAEARMDLLRFEMTSGARFPIGIADRDKTYAFLQANLDSGPVYFPQLVLIDRAGTIRAQYGGSDDFFAGGKEVENLRAMVEMLLKENTTGAKK